MNKTPLPMFPFGFEPKKTESFIKWQKNIANEMMKGLKEYFKKDIKESFLINMLGKIKTEYKDIENYYPNFFNFNPTSFIQGTNESLDFDICCHIVGIHKFNMLFLEDDKKGEFQKNTKYQNKLAKQVYEHIKLRQYGSSFFRNKPIMTGDRFLYFPLGYDMFVATIYLFKLLQEEVVKKNKWFNFYESMLYETISILSLIENGLMIQAYPQVRNLIELYFKYTVLIKNPDSLKEYSEFCDYEIEYSATNKFNDVFLKKYNDKTCNVSIIDYLHFGWIDSIFEFNYLGNNKQYSIPGLYNYLKFIHKDERSFELLKESHNNCHGFSHGSTITVLYTLHSYFEFMTTLYIIIRAILTDICTIVGKNPIIEGIDIIRMIDSDFKDLIDKEKLLDEVSIKKYYSMK